MNNKILQKIIDKYFKEDVTIEELKELNWRGYIDLEVMIANERRLR